MCHLFYLKGASVIGSLAGLQFYWLDRLSVIGSVEPLVARRPDTQIFTSFSVFLCTCTQFFVFFNRLFCCWIWLNFLWHPIISSTWLHLIWGINSTQVVWTAALNSSDSFSAPSAATLILTSTGGSPTTSGALFLLGKMKQSVSQWLSLSSDHPNLILWSGFSD